MKTRGQIKGIKTLGFIGGGQMAEALIKGVLSKKLLQPNQIQASDPSEVRRNHLKETYNIETTQNNREVVQASEAIVLAVKPQVMAVVLEDIRPYIKKSHLVISIAAGITLVFLEKGLPEDTRIVRVMPNTPALVQAGAAALCGGKNSLKGDLDIVRQILEAVGKAVTVSEDLMDAVTGLSGSGPAYVFTFMEGLIDAGVREGLPRPIAQELVSQTILGAAIMCQNTGKQPAELISMVTSPGGTTIAGLYALERGAFRGVLMDAVRAATERSRELGG
ncbi:MAG: pyrroline-5-carboxylate reductase [Nitrospiraceae bacterium]|nr:pyrroline-5-carboxylate reductase [Nitrospiraceae bacterium]